MREYRLALRPRLDFNLLLNTVPMRLSQIVQSHLNRLELSFSPILNHAARLGLGEVQYILLYQPCMFSRSGIIAKPSLLQLQSLSSLSSLTFLSVSHTNQPLHDV